MKPILSAEPGEARRRRPIWPAPALAAGLLVLLACGCKVGPDYHRPALDVPGGYQGETAAATNSLADLPWWRIFHDDQLQALVQEALTNNYDLRIAIARVEQAHEH